MIAALCEPDANAAPEPARRADHHCSRHDSPRRPILQRYGFR
jgi:hypothetical protein